LVLLPYLLARGARACESAEVKPPEARSRYDLIRP
jgi:hypothetical protein